MNQPNKTITQYGYPNTLSEAGKPSRKDFKPSDVTHATVWTNFYGNPTYRLYFKNGDTLLCVDDYGAMNGLQHLSAMTVQRRKHLWSKS